MTNLPWSTNGRAASRAEVDHLIGDASKARKAPGWKPSVSFEQLVAMMVDADVARLSGKPTAPQWIPR